MAIERAIVKQHCECGGCSIPLYTIDPVASSSAASKSFPDNRSELEVSIIRFGHNM